jgi:Na+-transporting NADH:ubiquinone oxidoreductase subunit A
MLRSRIITVWLVLALLIVAGCTATSSPTQEHELAGRVRALVTPAGLEGQVSAIAQYERPSGSAGEFAAIDHIVSVLRGDGIPFEIYNYQAYASDPVSAKIAVLGHDLEPEAIRRQLVQSGQWTALRTRPYSKVPAVDAEAAAIFITAMDTHPLSADPAVIIAEQAEAFTTGQMLLARLTSGTVHVCAAEGADIPLASAANIQGARFDGPHPAGLAGTHVHFLEGVSAEKVVWTVGYQDVIAIGRLFLDGRLYTERVIALCGPQVENPRLLRTRLGADLQALCAGETKSGDNRVISGSVLGGRSVHGATAYLGRYHNQVSVLLEGRHREFMGWLSPGVSKHSNLGIYLSSFFGGKALPMTTNTNGSQRAMVPVGSYETVVPQDYLPTHLLRALVVGDTEMAQALGCLELEEEDLALCTYVCPGKYEYGPILRDNLTRIEKEG